MTASRPRHAAFTTLELLVSVVLLTIAMLGVVGIFNISSNAASRTAAHAELIEASAALRTELTRQLEHISPGLLVIDSPPPTLARAETADGPRYFRLRHDRLVFLAAHTGEEFQSFTNAPRRLNPADPATFRDPAASSQAILYFGAGIPVTGNTSSFAPPPLPQDDANLHAADWMLAERAILLLPRDPDPTDTWIPPDMSVLTGLGMMLSGGVLHDEFKESRMDAVVSASGGARATTDTIAGFIASKPINQIIRPTPVIASLWEPSWTPITASVGSGLPLPADYYLHTGFNFLSHLADFRIEWTDGRRIDPDGPDDDPTTLADNDNRTRWFGLAPDPNSDPDLSSIDTTLNFQARLRAVADPANPANPDIDNPDNPAAETAAFAAIEWSSNGVSPALDAAYRAIWRADTWQFRPRALRFSYRLYDPGGRLKTAGGVDLDEDGKTEPESGPATLVTRWGQEFSFVVPLP